MEARKVTFTAKPGTFRDAVRAYKKYKEEKEQRLERKLQQLEEEIQKAKYTAALGPKGRFACAPWVLRRFAEVPAKNRPAVYLKLYCDMEERK